MKKLSVFALPMLVLLLSSTWSAVGAATDPIDHLNEILNNRRAVEGYANCFLGNDDRHCNKDSRAIKSLLPNFITSQCGTCTLKQKKAVCKIIRALQEERYRHIWRALLEKYDSALEHRHKLVAFMKNCKDNLHAFD